MNNDIQKPEPKKTDNIQPTSGAPVESDKIELSSPGGENPKPQPENTGLSAVPKIDIPEEEDNTQQAVQPQASEELPVSVDTPPPPPTEPPAPKKDPNQPKPPIRFITITIVVALIIIGLAYFAYTKSK